MKTKFITNKLGYCRFCNDGNNQCKYPYYGEPSIIYGTGDNKRFVPENNYEPDPAENGLKGTFANCNECGNGKMPELGLVIRKEWLWFILGNGKTWEMRSRATKVRGQIALIEAGSGLIVGKNQIIDSLKPIRTAEEFQENESRHCISLDRHYEDFKWRTPWVLGVSVKYDKPIRYKHPQGAVTWVKLTEEVLV